MSVWVLACSWIGGRSSSSRPMSCTISASAPASYSCQIIGARLQLVVAQDGVERDEDRRGSGGRARQALDVGHRCLGVGARAEGRAADVDGIGAVVDGLDADVGVRGRGEAVR
jgi:hypothetical protein